MASTSALRDGAVRPSRERPNSRDGRSSRTSIARFLPVVPSILLLALFMAGPVIWSVTISFTNTALTGRNAKDPSWVGFENYTRLLQDPGFPVSVWLTVVFVVASAVIGQNVLGLVIALLLGRVGRATHAIVTTIVVGAWVLPEIVAAFAAYAYFADDGTLNQLLAGIGIDGANWLYEFPMLAVILANVWRGTAFSMMVYEAALNDVPPEITEAAVIDGAGGLKRLIWVTIPMIRGSIATNLMLITLQTLAVFTLIWVMTKGGPGISSTTLPILAYQEAFKFQEIGYGSAIAVVMILIGAVFSVLYLRTLRPGRDA
ncbi:multiple sugar transport system permease protein [Agromyces hippuratus]|uniref:Multiple sugar transport system permease protein n=1 Tax=Agromyces hippuratus TaxID=286438 RepID=A0A852WXE4_9MICO|nr:multiple sugar transport system permease protein [Agromyces hippuratus]